MPEEDLLSQNQGMHSALSGTCEKLDSLEKRNTAPQGLERTPRGQLGPQHTRCPWGISLAHLFKSSVPYLYGGRWPLTIGRDGLSFPLPHTEAAHSLLQDPESTCLSWFQGIPPHVESMTGPHRSNSRLTVPSQKEWPCQCLKEFSWLPESSLLQESVKYSFHTVSVSYPQEECPLTLIFTLTAALGSINMFSNHRTQLNHNDSPSAKTSRLFSVSKLGLPILYCSATVPKYRI